MRDGTMISRVLYAALVACVVSAPCYGKPKTSGGSAAPPSPKGSAAKQADDAALPESNMERGFEKLRKLHIDDLDIDIWYDPDLGVPMSEKVEPPDDVPSWKVLQTRISSDSRTKMYVECYRSADDDSIRFCRGLVEQDNRTNKIYSAPGNVFLFPGNGTAYSSFGGADCFERTIMYRFDGKQFVKVPQPFYYVGSEVTTKKPLSVETSNGKTISIIAPGSRVTVIVADEQRTGFLVRTPLGLVGWAGQRDLRERTDLQCNFIQDE